MQDTTRNASLGDLAEILASQHSRKLDVIAPAKRIRSEGGLLVVEGTEPILTPDGVTSADGRYRPTKVADEGLAEKLGIPRKYLARLRDERPDLLDANINGWLRGGYLPEVGTLDLPNTAGPGSDYHWPGDPRKFLVRAFRPDDEGGTGVARAFLSDSYRIVDNLDVLTAALEGVRASGVHTEVQGTDLTERRMYVKLFSPEVAELAPELLAGYRSPYSGNVGTDNPTVFAGFVLANSEVGGGAFTLTPRIVIEICGNGMTFTADALRSIHLGARQDEGVVRWSDETQAANLELVRNQARDAVATFLDPDYLRAKIGQLTEAASADAGADEVQAVTKSLAYSEERTASVLDAFIRGGQPTLGGIAHAITAAAQREEDADVAAEMEAQAVSVLVGA